MLTISEGDTIEACGTKYVICKIFNEESMMCYEYVIKNGEWQEAYSAPTLVSKKELEARLTEHHQEQVTVEFLTK